MNKRKIRQKIPKTSKIKFREKKFSDWQKILIYVKKILKATKKFLKCQKLNFQQNKKFLNKMSKINIFKRQKKNFECQKKILKISKK